MPISKVPASFSPHASLIDTQTGKPTTNNGTALLNALVQRTGGGTGIVNKVTPQNTLLTATGTTMGEAVPLTTDWNHVGTTPANAGVQIHPDLDLKPGNDIWVFNHGANNLNVYPPDNQTAIGVGVTPGDPFVLAPGKSRCFQCLATSGNGQNGLFSSYGS